MFKRIRWMTLGAIVGAAGSTWARRRVRELARGAPASAGAAVGAAVARRGREVATEIAEALREGRAAMVDREAQLRARLDPGAPAERLGEDDRLHPTLHLVESTPAPSPDEPAPVPLRRWSRPARRRR